MTVKATREGLIGRRTASGYVIDNVVPFVALPSVSALGKFIRVTNPANEASCIAIVLDVGPWNEHDDAYVSGGNRPAAESGKDSRGPHYEWRRHRSRREGLVLAADEG